LTVALSGATEVGEETKFRISPELADVSVKVRFDDVPFPTNVIPEEPSVENAIVPLETPDALTAVYLPVGLHPVSLVQPVLPFISMLPDCSDT
jgi:hypothetical protein